jgi:N-acetyl-beta-hexosaminidase
VRCLDWQGVSGGVKAAQAGHGVIMTPTSHCYIDYRQSLKCAPAPALLRAPSACISAA